MGGGYVDDDVGVVVDGVALAVVDNDEGGDKM